MKQHQDLEYLFLFSSYEHLMKIATNQSMLPFCDMQIEYKKTQIIRYNRSTIHCHASIMQFVFKYFDMQFSDKLIFLLFFIEPTSFEVTSKKASFFFLWNGSDWLDFQVWKLAIISNYGRQSRSLSLFLPCAFVKTSRFLSCFSVCIAQLDREKKYTSTSWLTGPHTYYSIR